MLRKIFRKETSARFTAIITEKSGMLTQDTLIVHRCWQPEWSQHSLASALILSINYHQEEPASPLDAALDAYASDAKIPIPRGRPMTAYRFSATTLMSGNVWHYGREYELAIKGAPEAVLEYCDLTESEREETYKMLTSMASDGHQVVAVAYRIVRKAPVGLQELSRKEKLSFAGLIAAADTPRPEMRKAIKDAHQAGIPVFMITGDHIETAFHTGRQLGLVSRRSQVIDSRRLHFMTDEERETAIGKALIFARTTPKSKRSIIAQLEKHYIIATADSGKEDLPALMKTLHKKTSIATPLRRSRTSGKH